MKYSFSISQVISYGWETFKKNWKFLIVFFIIVFLADLIPGWLHDYSKDNISYLSPIFTIIGFIIGLITSIGVIVITLKFVDGKKPVYEDVYQHYSLILNYFLSSVIYVVVIIVGLILLVVPGIYWGIKYQFYGYYVVDKKMGPIEAIKASGKLTTGVKWKLLGFNIICVLISLLGVIVFGIGLLVATPIVHLATSKVFRTLQKKS